jgi:hypothetical protein
MPLAREFGLENRVSEKPGRIGYRAMLETLASAGGLVLFGSDDPAYTASKLYPYLLAGKPLIVICHARSPMVDVMRSTGGGVCITFDEDGSSEPARQVCAALSGAAPLVPLDVQAFEPLTARAQAGRVGAWLRASVRTVRGR